MHFVGSLLQNIFRAILLYKILISFALKMKQNKLCEKTAHISHAVVQMHQFELGSVWPVKSG